jgi:hypothetical protein
MGGSYDEDHVEDVVEPYVRSVDPSLMECSDIFPKDL